LIKLVNISLTYAALTHRTWRFFIRVSSFKRLLKISRIELFSIRLALSEEQIPQAAQWHDQLLPL